MRSFVGQSRIRELCPPARRREKRKKERFYIYSDVTHTHTPGRDRVNPERQEEEKSGHKRRANTKTAQGREGNRRTSGTNLHGETDLTRNRAHTYNPTTHYGEAAKGG